MNRIGQVLPDRDRGRPTCCSFRSAGSEPGWAFSRRPRSQETLQRLYDRQRLFHGHKAVQGRANERAGGQVWTQSRQVTLNKVSTLLNCVHQLLTLIKCRYKTANLASYHVVLACTVCKNIINVQWRSKLGTFRHNRNSGIQILPLKLYRLQCGHAGCISQLFLWNAGMPDCSASGQSGTRI